MNDILEKLQEATRASRKVYIAAEKALMATEEYQARDTAQRVFEEANTAERKEYLKDWHKDVHTTWEATKQTPEYKECEEAGYFFEGYECVENEKLIKALRQTSEWKNQAIARKMLFATQNEYIKSRHEAEFDDCDTILM